jgi:hypothetical protein
MTASLALIFVTGFVRQGKRQRLGDDQIVSGFVRQGRGSGLEMIRQCTCSVE